LNAQYSNAQGDTLVIEYCVNGAYVATEETPCTSPPNSCGMTGTGFITTVVSHNDVGNSQSACSAVTPSDSLCPSSGSSSLCPDGSPAPNGDTSQCTCAQGNASACNNGNNTCPQGELSEGSSCVTSCGSGYTQEGNGCVFICPQGELSEGSSCVASCDIGYAQQGSQCVFSSCPSGYTEETDANGNPACVAGSGGVCEAGPVCVNGNAYTQDSSCKLSNEQVCNWGCSNGQCLPPPAPEIATWQVKPTLIQSGEMASIQWQAQNVASCTVTGTNGDNWTGLTGTQTSKPITGQTIYTIVCQGFPGASPQSASDSTTINIAPEYQEQ